MNKLIAQHDDTGIHMVLDNLNTHKLGIELARRPFAKSRLQQFRAQLLIHDQARAIFERSLQLARETGYLKGGRRDWRLSWRS